MGFNIFAQSRGGMVYSFDFLAAVVAGQVPGFAYYSSSGRSNSHNTTKYAVWDAGDAGYVYTDPASPEGYRLSCSDNAAVNNIVIDTLDSDWATNCSTHTLTGQTATSVGSFIRAFGIKVIGPGRTAAPGTIYLTGSGAITTGEPGTTAMIRSMILTPNNRSLMSIYPVPAGRTAYVLGFWKSINKASGVSALAADVELWVAGTAMPFQQICSSSGVNIGGDSSYTTFELPYPVVEKSDIELRAACSTAADISAGFDLLLVDN